MEYVNLGSTGLKVSRICLGTMTYGSKKWREWVLEDAEARPFYRRAIEAGINFFDTADVYSLGVSEEITGRALKEYGSLPRAAVMAPAIALARDGFVLSRDDTELLDAKADRFAEDPAAALQKLGVWDAVQPHVAGAENVRAALLFVDRKETPLGIVYATDAASDPKVKIVGVFPEDTHPPIIYPAALTVASKNPDAVKFLQFLESPAARAPFEKQGFTVLGAAK